LRPYQRQGVPWLALRLALRHGVLLADDMSLGKTCLVVPASLIGNWRIAGGEKRIHLKQFGGSTFDPAPGRLVA
jgi:SNF2 family DNA or RNA helicase